MIVAEASLSSANEGSFGPHPTIPFILADTEILLFIDDERGIQVQEVLASEQVVAAQCAARSLEEIEAFLTRVRFPSHGLIVRPEGIMQPDLIFKGITDVQQLSELIRCCASCSPAGLAHIETDLRAHMNPTRCQVIARLADQMAQRLARLCPQCATPGWGRVDVVRGLPCEWCDQSTDLISADVFGCPACVYKETQYRQDRLQKAPAAQCPYCNP